ncbi:MAG TPA: MFS transporter [Xanthobacteraceae bacterium]|nr:MFS transporter [Xanthobacteraceae bacterium]
MTSEANAGARLSGAEIESSYAWLRLGIALALGTIGSIGMWSFVVALPAVQADFGVARGEASLPFTLTMLGFGFGGVVTGRFADRYGIVPPAFCGALALGAGYVTSGMASTIWWFALAQGLIGFGSSATFGPLMTDISHWFSRRRGIAVAIASCGNYLAGTIWPPLVQYFIATDGWRVTQIGIGIMCVLTMLPLVFALRRRAPMQEAERIGMAAVTARGSLGISSGTLMVLLCIAGVACCVAMSMPQVHIVAYCGDLGYGPARGAEMLAMMMGFGLVSRLAAGVIADRIGGLATLLIASLLQGVALFLYLWFDGLTSLYVISALFGLFQGGLVPMYAIIVREFFVPHEAGTRLGFVLLATLFGMAVGGWMSGAIFDLTGTYKAAFLNGLLWNLLNIAIILWLVFRQKRRAAYA